MKWGVIKILGIFAFIGFSLSIWHYAQQPDQQPAPQNAQNFIKEAAIGRFPAPLKSRLAEVQNPEKRLSLSIRGTFLNPERQITRIDTPLFYSLKDTHVYRPGKFSLELYRVAEKPNTHFHIRAVDHNNIGYGGGLKIALEIVETF